MTSPLDGPLARMGALLPPMVEANDGRRHLLAVWMRTSAAMRRELETATLRRRVNEVVDLAPIDDRQAVRDRLLGRLDDLELSLSADTATFTQKAAAAGNVLLSEVNTLAVAAGTGADDFRAATPVQALVTTAQAFADAGTQVKPENELQTYLRTTRAAGPKLRVALGE
ncbi:MAG TPA: hypothetical protein VLB47_01000 [Solirubrobacteraceae bacterium]|nr:hypothetical protein [Solirubrobacteraceae bacterium]